MTKELQKNILRWQKKASARKEDGVFIVEGIRMFSEIPPERLLYAVLSEGFVRNSPEDLKKAEKVISAAEKGTKHIVPDNVFEKLSDTETPQGILAVVRAFNYRTEDILSAENGLFVLLETLQDPGNLGTVIRSAEAAGAAGVFMNETTADIYNPKVIRSTMGSLFRVPFKVVPDLSVIVSAIREKGGRTYAAHLKESVDYTLPDYKGMTAFMIGNEAKGLSDALTEAADGCVRIPMQGKVESLNAAMAATVLLYEAARQRRC